MLGIVIVDKVQHSGYEVKLLPLSIEAEDVDGCQRRALFLHGLLIVGLSHLIVDGGTHPKVVDNA